MGISKQIFGKLQDGRTAWLYKLENNLGAAAYITDFGGAVVKLYVPDRDGKFDDVVCGYDDLESYINGDGYQGAIIGRFGNRIADGRFTLDGQAYCLHCNDGNNHLHGGKKGFSHRLWDAELLDDELILHLVSDDGDEGYPGKLSVSVSYKLTDFNGGSALEINYSATTNKKTIVNLTNHTYFNLGGYASGDVLSHTLDVDADSYLPTNEKLIPTGEIKSVIGTPFCFNGNKICNHINSDDIDINIAGGYDHCFVFNGGGVKYSELPPLRCEMYCANTGRRMEVFTDRPCVQIYTANFMSNPNYPFKGGVEQKKHHAICLETQAAPDSINHREFLNFSNCILNEGETFKSKTIYRFCVVSN